MKNIGDCLKEETKYPSKLKQNVKMYNDWMSALWVVTNLATSEDNVLALPIMKIIKHNR